MLEKIKEHLKLNSYLVWVCFLLICIATILVIGSVTSDIKNTNQEFKKAYTQMKAAIEKEISGVVVLTNSGQVLNVDKSYLDASTESSYNAAIKNVLINYLVFSNTELRDAFGNSKIKSIDELAQLYEPFKEFQENFLISKTINGKTKVTTEKWEYILNSLATESNELRLPDGIDILDSDILECSWINYQNFKIIVKVKVGTIYWNSIDNMWEPGLSSFTIKATGTVAIKDNTILNPLGIRFNWLDLTVPKKD